MKLTRKIAAVIASGMIAVSSMLSLPAAAFTLREESVKKDNDTANCYNSGFSYITGSQHKNSNARFSSSYYDEHWHLWNYSDVEMHPTSSGFGKMWLKLYLNDSTFNDFNAKYTIDFRDTTQGTTANVVMVIDQNAAPAGWSGATFYTNNSQNNHPYFIGNHTYKSSYVDLSPSGDWGRGTGADMVQTVFKFN